MHCDGVNNSYQQNSRVLHAFVPNKLFGQLLDISPKSFIFLKTFDSEFSYIKVWFTDQNSNLLETLLLIKLQEHQKTLPQNDLETNEVEILREENIAPEVRQIIIDD